MENQNNPYYQKILEKIEDYQKGQIPFDELKRIPKDDLLAAMREECNRISRRSKDLNSQYGPSLPS